jgi:holin-like protein
MTPEWSAPMILHFATLLIFQLIGEVLSRTFLPILPGPVLGLALILIFFIGFPKAAAAIHPTATGLLAHLSLLFVPAGVGVVGHLDLISSAGPALIATLFGSTVLAIAVGALTFEGLAKWMGQTDE